jgi:hypothetical protein
MLDSSAVGVLRALGEQSVETKYNCDEWLKTLGAGERLAYTYNVHFGYLLY